MMMSLGDTRINAVPPERVCDIIVLVLLNFRVSGPRTCA